MIPADHISFNDDGTAWMIVDHCDGDHPEGENKLCDLACKSLDRPCDRCYGRGAILIENQGEESCPANCIDGRHTFWLDVEVSTSHVGSKHDRHDLCEHCFGYKRHRVSVVPGMVLPIAKVDGTGYPHPKPADRFAYVTERGVIRVVDAIAKTDTHSGQAPSAAKPGMWAIKLKILNS